MYQLACFFFFHKYYSNYAVIIYLVDGPAYYRIILHTCHGNIPFPHLNYLQASSNEASLKIHKNNKLSSFFTITVNKILTHV